MAGTAKSQGRTSGKSGRNSKQPGRSAGKQAAGSRSRAGSSGRQAQGRSRGGGAKGTRAKGTGAKAAGDVKPINATPADLQFIKGHKNLSKTTKRAKWIHTPDEHEDRPGQSLATRSVEVIRSWAEQRQAAPATVQSARATEDRPRTLRFDFAGAGAGRGRLEPVDWEDWFRTFQERDLVFIFQEHLRDGRPSNFFRLDNPNRENA